MLYRQLSNLQEQVFDELVVLAATLCHVPIAFISLLEAQTVWFKHTTGWLGQERLPLDSTLCSVVLLQQTTVLFPDLQQAPCRQIQSAEINALGLQFYLGVPLRIAPGEPFGVLAILDQQPRQPQVGDCTLLQHIADLISTLFDFYATEAQTPLRWPMGNSHLYETITHSMEWIHTLAKQAQTISSVHPLTYQTYLSAISQETEKLASFIRQHVEVSNRSSGHWVESYVKQAIY